jgi:hypothetical protein
MPPRYAYWTILIDGKATAFRAHDREELLPTLNQLRRKNGDVALRYFARGKLWDSPEQAEWAGKNPRSEDRGRDWRPGGSHRDPRARFDAPKDKRPKERERPHDARSDRRPPPNPNAPASFGSRGDQQGGRRPWTPKPPSHRRPWGAKPPASDRRPWDDRPREARGARDARGSREDGSSRNAGRGEGKKPWTPRPRDQRRDDRSAQGPDAPRRPWDQSARRPDDRGSKPGRFGNERRPWDPASRQGDDRGRNAKSRGNDRRPWQNDKRPWDPESRRGHDGGWKPKSSAPDKHGSDRSPRRTDDRPDSSSRRNDDRGWKPKPRGADRRPWENDRTQKADRAQQPRNDRNTGRDRGSRPTGGRDERSRQDRPSQKPWDNRRPRGASPNRRDGKAQSPDGRRPREDWRKRPDTPDERREALPKPDRPQLPDQPPAAEQIVTKPKPPERG